VCFFYWFSFGFFKFKNKTKKKNKNFIDFYILFRSSVVYYPLAQQSTLQQPVYLTPTTGGTATTWPTNIFSQFNLATTSNTTVPTTSTSSPQTVYEIPTALFETSSSPTAGQQLYWPSYN